MNENLVGAKINDDWVLEKSLFTPDEENKKEFSGSFFSCGYIASNGKDKSFVKIIDVAKALAPQEGTTLMQRLKLLGDTHNFECSILDICTRAKLDRVVTIIGYGEIPAPVGDPHGIPLPYIMFELADGDIRRIISRTKVIDDAWRFRVIHNIATGLQQLHQQEIAHQDLKPSNVLIFDDKNDGAKLGDLGRASKKHLDIAHDDNVIAGALKYAPPEQIYGIRAERWQDRREACDLYQMGSLILFLFTGQIPTQYFVNNMPPEIKPGLWGGLGTCDYETALPFLISHLIEFVATVENDFPSWAREELKTLVIQACNPDYRLRGDPGARARTGNPLGLEVFISKFDRLSKQAIIESRK